MSFSSKSKSSLNRIPRSEENVTDDLTHDTKDRGKKRQRDTEEAKTLSLIDMNEDETGEKAKRQKRSHGTKNGKKDNVKMMETILSTYSRTKNVKNSNTSDFYDTPKNGVPLETIVLEDDYTDPYGRPLRSENRNKKYEDDCRDTEDSGNNCDEEGSYVRFTPIAVESELENIAKKGYAQDMQNKALQNLMKTGEYPYCDDITQNPRTNKYYSDPNKTEKSFFNKTEREKYIESVSGEWMIEGFADYYKDEETMLMLEEYERLENVLEKKRTTIGTKTVDLPKISSKYVSQYLREPVEELGERPCIAGSRCTSVRLYEHLKKNVPLVPKEQRQQQRQRSNESATTWSSVDSSGRRHIAAEYVKISSEKTGFVLREFLLPEQKDRIEADYNLGLTYKQIMSKVEKRHCILCNRFITTYRAIRIACGASPPPGHTIQDHRNFFDCPGEYPNETMLQPSDGYCGIIDGIVKFCADDYVPACIEKFEYVPRFSEIDREEKENKNKNENDDGEDDDLLFESSKKTVRVRSWFERRLMKTLKETDEEGRFLPFKTITIPDVKYPKSERLLNHWYPASVYDAHPEISTKEKQEALASIWSDDFDACEKNVAYLVKFLFGWEENKILTESDYDRYFPYWSVNKFPITVKKSVRYLTLLLRVNFACFLRKVEIKYARRSFTGGSGPYGMGCFYDYRAYVQSNVQDQKRGKRKESEVFYESEFTSCFDDEKKDDNDDNNVKNGSDGNKDVSGNKRSRQATERRIGIEADLRAKKSRENVAVDKRIPNHKQRNNGDNDNDNDNDNGDGNDDGDETRKRESKKKKPNFYEEKYIKSNRLDATLVGSSHRLFKLNVFLEAHYAACKRYNESTLPDELRFEKSERVSRVPLRRCNVDKKYAKAEERTADWLDSLKGSLKRYESVLFSNEKSRSSWDSFYRRPLMEVYSFVRMPELNSDDEKTKLRREKIRNAICSERNVEMLFQVGMGYGDPLHEAPNRNPYLYHLSSADKEVQLFGTDRSLLISVLYVLCSCENATRYAEKRYPISLAHSSTVVEWFGTSTSKSGAFPAFVDKKRPDDEKKFFKEIIREFETNESLTSSTNDKGNAKLVQKTIQNVYSEQLAGQKTREFYEMLEKYLFLLHSYKMSFMKIMLYYKRHRFIDHLCFEERKQTRTSKEKREEEEEGKEKEEEEEEEEEEKESQIFDLDSDSSVPFALFFPFENTKDEGEEGLWFGTQYALPYIDEILNQVEFWSKTSWQDICAIAYAYKKCLTYRSQCRDMPKKTGDTCKKDPMVYSYFKTILHLTMIGGYLRCNPVNFSSVMATEPTTTTTTTKIEEWKEGRFYNYTVRPPFYACMIITDKILNQEEDMKRVLNFIEYQKIFSQQIWRENLIHVVHRHPHLRSNQPYLDWQSFENGTDFATNCYRAHLIDTLMITRNSESKSPLFTENVLKRLIKNEDCAYLDEKLHHERTFEKIKKMSKIHAFTKEDFLNEISNKMTSYQDKMILYEMELKQTIKDLEKSAAVLFRESKRKEEKEGKEEKDHRPNAKYEEGKDYPESLNLRWNKEDSTFVFDSMHESAQKNVNRSQKIVKKLLYDVLKKNENYDFPKCTVEDPESSFIFDGYSNMKDFLLCEKSRVTSSVLIHYASEKKAELEKYETESEVKEETKQFLRKFAMKEHSGWSLTKEETERGLMENLEPSGLEIYSELKSLYPDKMKPKAVNDILEKTKVRVFYKLYYLFRMQQFANSIKLVSLDQATINKIDVAMNRRRYGVIEGKETLPPSVYDVFVTSCCNRVATECSPGSYGQNDISYNHMLNAFVCNKKVKKRASSIRWDDVDKAKTIVSLSSLPSEPSSSSSSSRSPIIRKNGTKDKDDKGDGGAKKKEYAFRDIKNCDEKTKYKIAKREKRDRETTPCLNAKAFIINLKGYKMVHRTKGKSLKVYGHCPTCGQFHVMNRNSKSGFGGYSCAYCKRSSPEDYVIRKCAHCGVTLTERQYEYSMRIPLIDVGDSNDPIKRLSYCKFHVPKKSDYYNQITRFGGTAGLSFDEGEPMLSDDSLSAAERRKMDKFVLVYDSEILPNVFLDEHADRLKKRSSLSKTSETGRNVTTPERKFRSGLRLHRSGLSESKFSKKMNEISFGF